MRVAPKARADARLLEKSWLLKLIVVETMSILEKMKLVGPIWNVYKRGNHAERRAIDADVPRDISMRRHRKATQTLIEGQAQLQKHL